MKRIIDSEIAEQLDVAGVISIRGPKWCGKTTTAEQFSKSTFKVQGDEEHPNNTELAIEQPYIVLKGENPRLIDEWQLAPELWNAARNNVDNIPKHGLYIFTGSATPNESNTSKLHSGAGRFAFIDMKPMSLYESGDSNGKISLKDLFNHKFDIDGISCDMTYEKMAFLICRGGWPDSIGMNEKSALKVSSNYVEAVVSSDISRIDGVSRNKELAKNILKSYARMTSTIDSNDSLYKDVQANQGNVSKSTIIDYLNQFKKLYLIDEIEAWSPNIRSKTAIRTSPKKSFVDPSIATAALNVMPGDLILDRNTYGLLFENIVDRDLSIYMRSLGGRLSHYRDRYGLEVDQILHLGNDKYALVETKTSIKAVPEAEEHLLKLKETIIENQPKLGEPEFMMVVVNDQMAYTTKNGILVVPIGCLKN